MPACLASAKLDHVDRARSGVQLDGERRPVTERTLRDDRSAHQLGQALGQRQTQSRALHPGLLGVETIKRDEQPLELLGRDPRTGIATVIRTRSAAQTDDTVTVSPGRLYFTALESRLSTTWRSRWRSARTWQSLGPEQLECSA